MEKEGKWGFVDRFGETAIPFEYDWTGPFHDGLAMVKRGGQIGYINMAGKTVIDFQYENSLGFHEGYATVFQNHQVGVIDKQGNPVIPLSGDLWMDRRLLRGKGCRVPPFP